MHYPQPGDVVRAWFPEWPSTRPGPKARPCLVLDSEQRNGVVFVQVAYGTSQRTAARHHAEFTVTMAEKTGWLHCNEKDTKFNLRQTEWLPMDPRWVLDVVGDVRTPSCLRKMAAAYNELQKP